MKKWFVRTFPNAAGTVYSVCRGTARYNTDSLKDALGLQRKLNHKNVTISTALRLKED
jgi:hypothetical protein